MTDDAHQPIYLDYAATTPVDPRVVEAMLGCLGPQANFANPASAHLPGETVKSLVELAREQIADRLGAQPHEIVFTSGATESTNLALKGSVLTASGAPQPAAVPQRLAGAPAGREAAARRRSGRRRRSPGTPAA